LGREAARQATPSGLISQILLEISAPYVTQVAAEQFGDRPDEGCMVVDGVLGHGPLARFGCRVIVQPGSDTALANGGFY
jgi:hypothetical protein